MRGETKWKQEFESERSGLLLYVGCDDSSSNEVPPTASPPWALDGPLYDPPRLWCNILYKPPTSTPRYDTTVHLTLNSATSPTAHSTYFIIRAPFSRKCLSFRQEQYGCRNTKNLPLTYPQAFLLHLDLEETPILGSLMAHVPRFDLTVAMRSATSF